METSTEFAPGDRFGPYHILQALGRGGMGEVFRARQSSLNREVALKFLRASMSGDDSMLVRFEREMRLAAAFSHPNLVKIFDGGVLEGRPYIAMELLRGETLLARSAARGALPWRDVLDIGSGILSGLTCLHAHDVLHRDIKPANIFLTDTREVKLLDFGTALALGESRLTADGEVLGTLGYLAPELFLGQAASPASDLWSVGAVLYEALTGVSPFANVTAASLLRELLARGVEAPSLKAPGIPAELDSLVLSLLSLDPGRRPQVASKVEDQLRGLVQTRPVRIAPDLREPRPKKVRESTGNLEEQASAPRRRPALRIGLGILGMLGLLAALSTERIGSTSKIQGPISHSTANAISPSRTPDRRSFTAEGRELESSLPALMGNPARAAERVAELRRKSRVDPGESPRAWIYWIELCRWLEDPSRPPPRASRASQAALESLFGGTLFTFMQEVDRHPPDDSPSLSGSTGLASAVRLSMEHPADAASWLALGRFVEIDRDPATAAAVYAEGLKRLPAPSLAGAPHALWTALARALLVVPGRRIEDEWLDLVRKTGAGDNAWVGLFEAFPIGDWSRLQGLLEAGARDPTTEAAAASELGKLAILRERDHPRALAIWESALRKYPESSGLGLTIFFDRISHGQVQEAADLIDSSGISGPWKSLTIPLVRGVALAPEAVRGHDDLMDLVVRNALESGNRALALEIALRGGSWAAGPAYRGLVLEILAEGVEDPGLQKIAVPFLSPREWSEVTSIAGIFSVPSAERMMAGLLEGLAVPDFTPALRELARALWHSRRQEHHDALQALDRARREKIDEKRMWQEILEIRARPLWVSSLGWRLEPAVLDRARGDGDLPALDDIPLVKYWTALRSTEREATLREARNLYDLFPYSPGIVLMYGYAAASQEKGDALIAALERCRCAARQNRLGLWAIRELGRLLPEP